MAGDEELLRKTGEEPEVLEGTHEGGPLGAIGKIQPSHSKGPATESASTNTKFGHEGSHPFFGDFVTFGLLMGLEPQDTSAGVGNKNALLIFCPTGELEAGTIAVTQRMMDLALSGFQAVAITRWNLEGIREYAIFRKEDLSDALRNAVLNDAGNIVRKAIEDFEL